MITYQKNRVGKIKYYLVWKMAMTKHFVIATFALILLIIFRILLIE